MEQLKVIKKDIVSINTLLFLVMAFFFLFIQHAYRHQISPFSWVYFKKGIELFWYVAVMLVLTGFFIWKHHRYAPYLFQAAIFLVGFKIIEGLFIEFNKVIVIALFFFIVISYFLYQLLNYYFGQASVNPNYASSDLFPPLLKEIHCRLLSGDGVIEGTLSNWDELGCFVKLSVPRELRGGVRVVISFRDREFSQDGEVVASIHDFSGVGIKFETTIRDLTVFNWSEFIEIVDELGFEPQRLR
jgi:hypothetical protein